MPFKEMENGRRPSFELSEDGRALYNVFVQCAVGDTVTFEELGNVIDDQVDGGDGRVQAARNRAEKNEECVFENVRGVGYKRLEDHEIVNIGEGVRKGIRRRARKTTRRIKYVKRYDKLNAADKVKHNTWLSLFATIDQVTSPSEVRKVEQRVKEVEARLPVQRTLKQFINGS